MKKDSIIQLVKLLAAVVLVGLGASLSLTAGIGLGAYDAFNAALSNASAIQVGTIVMIANSIFVVLQLLLLRKNFRWIQFLQLAVSYIVGEVINFFVYGIFDSFVPGNYLVRILLLLAGTGLSALAVGYIMAVDWFTMPLEGFCLAFSQHYRRNFGRVRQIADYFFLAAAPVLAVMSGTPLTIREGTLFSALFFSPVMSRVYEQLKEKKKEQKPLALPENQ